MRVYIYGKRGGRGNFKITTTEIYSSLDYLIEEALDELIEKEKSGSDYYYRNLVDYLNGWSLPVIYWNDIDSGMPARKVTEKMWQEAVKNYSEKNVDKIAKYELLKKK